MTPKQIRDRIVGALSVSMMPVEVEAECVRFLDRRLWVPVTERTPKVRVRFYEDLDYFESDPVLILAEEGCMAVCTMCVTDGIVFWTEADGTEYTPTHWMPLPEVPG